MRWYVFYSSSCLTFTVVCLSGCQGGQTLWSQCENLNIQTDICISNFKAINVIKKGQKYYNRMGINRSHLSAQYDLDKFQTSLHIPPNLMIEITIRNWQKICVEFRIRKWADSLNWAKWNTMYIHGNIAKKCLTFSEIDIFILIRWVKIDQILHCDWAAARAACHCLGYGLAK